MKLSFDFDGTLSNTNVQRYARSLIRDNHDVWIVTNRRGPDQAQNPRWNDDLYFVAESIGIENIHFTNRNKKSDFFSNNRFDWHLDDDIDDVMDINENTDTEAIHLVLTYRMEVLDKCRKMITDNKLNG